MSKEKRENYKEVRKIVLDELKRDLIGPSYDQPDIITEPPTQSYLTGILFPLESAFEQEEEEELEDAFHMGEENLKSIEKGEYNPTEDDNEKGIEKNKTFKQQNSIGVKFYVMDTVKEINVKCAWGKYNKDKKFIEEKDKEIPIWVREISTSIHQIDIENYKEPIEVSSGVYLILKKMRIKETNNLLVSIFLVNRNIDKNSNNALYQVSMELSHDSGEKIFLSENNARKDTSNFDEFLYRNKPVFAKGFGCAVEWDDYDSTYARKLKTEFIPGHEVASMSTELPYDENFGDVSDDYFSIKQLAEERDRDVVIEKLTNLADRYENWIEILPLKEVEDQCSAKKSIEQCYDSLSRIREGIKILGENEDAFNAFVFMNEVMHTQISMKNFAKNKESRSLEEELTKENFSWRPFQLAFILLNLSGIVKPNSEDREIVDLLWFPTGGGKTEAYLGIAAFLLGFRRIDSKNNQEYNKDGGVTIILRYTLRLLTTQQRDRLMRVICASEYIRAKRVNSKVPMGNSEFSIGFWVGGQVTTNKFKDLKESNYQTVSKVSAEYKKLEKQVIECPCCGTKEPLYKFLPNRDTSTEKFGLRIYCRNTNCYYSNHHIPVYLIDEEIYRRTPSVIISTVDKFARLPWDEKTGALFGKVNRYCDKCGYIAQGEDHPSFHRNPSAKVMDVKPFYPPELIIQDELHLITGPLGTIYGAYETAIEELCTVKSNGESIKPKYVAATATIKNADEQVKRIFGRTESRQFPPAGLEIEDSFFGREISVKDNPFRLYSGICVSGQSMKTVLLRVYAVLLQVTENLLDDPKYKDYIDPYRTLIGYFNSVRELGGAVRLLDDDIRKRIQTLQKKYRYPKQRFINRNEELTSRIPSYKIPKVLELLDREVGNNELDVALATNMISVGMDVDRLGLMVITGQPKQTSEYIQASSRVGRNKPGLVVTIYNPYRPRDLSHYQNFKGYHSRLYHYVEGTTATPFASRARDRSLHAIAVSVLRITESLLAKNEDAGNVRNIDLGFLRNLISERVKVVDSRSRVDTINDLNRFFDGWIHLSSVHENLQYYFYPNSKYARVNNLIRLLGRYSEKKEKHEKQTLDSMRQIEGTSKLYVYEGWINDEE
ncbi:DISARM system helicase DrmA [Halobacillus salinarum]|uniref:DISARM system helicase DrmA n=1 Tax=Halobacillus salinarum TaxID=2932257 RepID=A0ABY4EHX3_9BACI|nr:DISARM system helicase DrmA [Halobacillus salinarum]UOQ44065.1 DISARM system helicase DrmA [Halobacillus salinarum]